MFDTDKTRMIGLSCGEGNMTYDRIPERHGRTDGQTDRHTDRHNCCIINARHYADAR